MTRAALADLLLSLGKRLLQGLPKATQEDVLRRRKLRDAELDRRWPDEGAR